MTRSQTQSCLGEHSRQRKVSERLQVGRNWVCSRTSKRTMVATEQEVRGVRASQASPVEILDFSLYVMGRS